MTASDLRGYYGVNGDHDDVHDAGEYQDDAHGAHRDHDVQNVRDIRDAHGDHDAHGAHGVRENRASCLKHGCSRANGRPNDDAGVPKVRHPNYLPLSLRVRSRDGSGTHGRGSVRKGVDVRHARCGQGVGGVDDDDGHSYGYGYDDCVKHDGVHDVLVGFVNWYEENYHLSEYINSP